MKRYDLKRTKKLSQLINDFVFKDRRIADQPSLIITLRLAEDNLLRAVATSDEDSEPLPYLTVDTGITGFAYSGTTVVWAPEMPAHIREPGDEQFRSMIAWPLVGGARGVLNLASREQLDVDLEVLPRLQVLSALVSYELFHLQSKVGRPSKLSKELGLVFRQSREAANLTRVDLATLVGTNRSTLARWESGTLRPLRVPLRRWACALGLLAGGRPEIIRVVDATPQLLELLRNNPARLSELSPEQFEVIVAERLDRMGYVVQRTGSTTLRDGGIDIIAAPKKSDLASFLLAVQVKHHSTDRATGRHDIDRLLSWQNSAFRLGLLVTNTRFTRDAIWAASRDPAKHFLRLRDFGDLSRWLHDVFNSPFDWREIPESIELAPGLSIKVPKPQFTEAPNVWPLKNASLGPLIKKPPV